MKKYIVALAIVGAFAACQSRGTATESAAAKDTAMTAEPTATTETLADTAQPPAADTAATTLTQSEAKPMEDTKDQVADIKTTAGTVTIRFFPEVAPNHVRNFVELAKSGFYNGTKFHRVIPGFMVQGGDPNTKTANASSWGMGGSGKNVKAEFNSIPHRRGIVSMARANDPDSASSQFFIVVADSGFLDNKYTVFGQVTSGMDVADKIVNAKRDPSNDRPVDPVSIESVTLRAAKDSEKGPLPK